MWNLPPKKKFSALVPQNSAVNPIHIACPICTGMPGVLPVLNEKVVEFAVAVGLATNCDITPYGKFDRKNYFIPICPKPIKFLSFIFLFAEMAIWRLRGEGFQKKIGIHEIHMEEEDGETDPRSDFLTLLWQTIIVAAFP